MEGAHPKDPVQLLRCFALEGFIACSLEPLCTEPGGKHACENLYDFWANIKNYSVSFAVTAYVYNEEL